jgi:hypothetical protein
MVEVFEPTSTLFRLSTNCPPYNLVTDRTENTVSLLLFPIVTAQTYLLAKQLLSNGFSVFAYPAVVAQQRVYMPQYFCHHHRQISSF